MRLCVRVGWACGIVVCTTTASYSSNSPQRHSDGGTFPASRMMGGRQIRGRSLIMFLPLFALGIVRDEAAGEAPRCKRTSTGRGKESARGGKIRTRKHGESSACRDKGIPVWAVAPWRQIGQQGEAKRLAADMAVCREGYLIAFNHEMRHTGRRRPADSRPGARR